MKKRIFAVLAVAVLALSLVACGGTKDSGSGSGSGTGGGTEQTVVKVGVAIYKFDDNFMTLYREELQAYFESLSTAEVKYEVTVTDGKNDQVEQTNQIDQFISDKYDVIIANLVQPTAAASIVEKCQAAGIPIVFINREPEAGDMEIWAGYETYVGADARQSGRFQGEIINELENKGDINGDGKVSYIMLVGDPDNVDAQYRTEYSVLAVEESGMAVEKLFQERGDWDQVKGQELTANALVQYKDQIEVVFANNDAMAMGALQAIEAAGRVVNEDIYLVGVDALPEAIAAIAEGRMTGTVLNDHVGQSHTAVDVAIKLINGETVEPYYWVDYVKVTE